MSDYPDWTDLGIPLELHRGLYPLGIEAIGMGIVAEHLLPGITNATVHPRYYSFLSWVFWTFLEDLKRRGVRSFRLSDQQAWLLRLENVFRSATLVINRNITGLIGRTEAIEIDPKNTKGQLRVDGDKAASAFQAANYSTSFAALGCGKEMDGQVKLTSTGVHLAEAFHSRLLNIHGAREALLHLFSNAKKIPIRSVRTLAGGIGLRSVNPVDPEHPLLVDLLFRLAEDPERDAWVLEDRARSRSLGLLLEVARRCEGRNDQDSEELCHFIFASRRFPDGETFSVPTEFEDDFSIWERYQERQYLKLGLYGLWHEVNQLLRRQPSPTASTMEIVGHLTRLATSSRIVNHWLGKDSVKLSVGAAMKRVDQRAKSGAGEPGLAALALARTILDTKDSKERVGASIVLVLWITQFWRSIQETLPPRLRNLHATGGRQRLSLATLARDTDLRQDQTLQEFQAWLTECCVLSQAMRVALEKLSRGDFRFFVLRDGDGFRLVRPQEPRSYLTYDSSRLGSALSLLQDLRLVDLKNGLRLTQPGRALLRRVRTFHSRQTHSTIPEATRP